MYFAIFGKTISWQNMKISFDLLNFARKQIIKNKYLTHLIKEGATIYFMNKRSIVHLTNVVEMLTRVMQQNYKLMIANK